jgi:hypothetical protein
LTTAGLPRAGTVRLPASWQELFGDFRGRARFKRKFHPPSNLDRSTRLFIVLDHVEGSGTVLLNSQTIGAIEPGRTSARFEITGGLQLNNELEVELEFTETDRNRPGGLPGPVILEIQESADHSIL